MVKIGLFISGLKIHPRFAAVVEKVRVGRPSCPQPTLVRYEKPVGRVGSGGNGIGSARDQNLDVLGVGDEWFQGGVLVVESIKVDKVRNPSCIEFKDQFVS